jgi:hypothetical protein
MGVAGLLATNASDHIANFCSIINSSELLIKGTELYHNQQRSKSIISVLGILNRMWFLSSLTGDKNPVKHRLEAKSIIIH